MEVPVPYKLPDYKVQHLSQQTRGAVHSPPTGGDLCAQHKGKGRPWWPDLPSAVPWLRSGLGLGRALCLFTCDWDLPSQWPSRWDARVS